MDDVIEKLAIKNPIRFRISPQFIFVGSAIALVAYLTLVPLLMLIYGSLQSGQPGRAGGFHVEKLSHASWQMAPGSSIS